MRTLSQTFRSIKRPIPSKCSSSSPTKSKSDSSWCVYLILSTNPPIKTYVGVTTNFPRRLKEHNGELKGGAKASRAGRPWICACIVCGFTNRSEDLCEELWNWWLRKGIRYIITLAKSEDFDNIIDIVRRNGQRSSDSGTGKFCKILRSFKGVGMMDLCHDRDFSTAIFSTGIFVPEEGFQHWNFCATMGYPSCHDEALIALTCVLMRPLCHDGPMSWHNGSVSETWIIKARCVFSERVEFFDEEIENNTGDRLWKGAVRF